jgi:magnesium-transporting ATPase (P-type)
MQVVHSFTMDNVLVRGSRNVSGHELLCVVMETGIDSMLLSTVKYPYLSREEGVLNSAIKWVGIWCTIGYVLMVGLAVLTGYIYM